MSTNEAEAPLIEEEAPLIEEATQQKQPQTSSSSPGVDNPLFEPMEIGNPSLSDYDPFIERKVENPTSNLRATINLLKGTTGTGILAMPGAFKHAGYVVGPVGLLLIAFVSTYSMNLLLNCTRDICRRIRVPSLSFAEVAEVSFQLGPARMRIFAYASRIVVNSFLCLSQLGYCCVYFLFMPANIESFIRSRYSYEGLSIVHYMSIILVPMICLNLIRNLKLLAPFMMVANVTMVLGLGIIMYYMVQDLPPISERTPATSIDELPLYFGTAMYAFVSVGMILPLENSMKNPQDFYGWNGILNVNMAVVALVLGAFGICGYLKYGRDAKGSITLNLPPDELLAQSVRLLMALTIFLSYAIQFYVPINIMWPPIKERISGPKMQIFLEYVFRSFLVFLTYALAAGVPDLALFISLVGALCSTTLALIFPPIISMLTYWALGYGRCRWRVVKDVAIIIVGFIGMSLGTYMSIQEIIKKI